MTLSSTMDLLCALTALVAGGAQQANASEMRLHDLRGLLRAPDPRHEWDRGVHPAFPGGWARRERPGADAARENGWPTRVTSLAEASPSASPAPDAASSLDLEMKQLGELHVPDLTVLESRGSWVLGEGEWQLLGATADPDREGHTFVILARAQR